MKEEIKYEVQYFNDRFNKWEPFVCKYCRKKDAKDALRDFILTDLQHGQTYRYRILKLTIKKEVVK